jgi:peptidoglycan/LPS O-acetylase OafA/YrhL
MFLICITLISLYLLSGVNIYHHPKSNSFKIYQLDKKATEALKGILILIVTFSHLTAYIDCGIIKEICNYGALAVSVFFFISGYGLMKSLIYRKDYLTNFISKRFSKILPPIIIVTIIYIPLKVYFDGTNLYQLLKDLAKGHTLTPYAWYIYAIILYYLSFYTTFKIIKRKNIAIAFVFIMIILYTGIIKYLNWGAWWYISSFAFPMGLLYAYHEQKIIELLYIKSRVSTTLIYLANIFILLYCALGTYFMWPGWGGIMYNLIPLLIMPILYSFNLERIHILRFLGRISYEIYILHGIFIQVGEKYFDSYFLIIFVCVFSITSAYYLNKTVHYLN